MLTTCRSRETTGKLTLIWLFHQTLACPCHLFPLLTTPSTDTQIRSIQAHFSEPVVLHMSAWTSQDFCSIPVVQRTHNSAQVVSMMGGRMGRAGPYGYTNSSHPMSPDLIRFQERKAAWVEPSTQGTGGVQAETKGVPCPLVPRTRTTPDLPTTPKASQHELLEEQEDPAQSSHLKSPPIQNAGLTKLPGRCFSSSYVPL